MPVKAEDIYDAIATLIDTNLTGYSRMPNPYEIEENAFLTREKGYAIAIGAGADLERYATECLVAYERFYSITLAQRLVATRENTDLREEFDKNLMEDHRTLLKAFINDMTLSGKATQARVIADSGITALGGDRNKFIVMDLEVLVEYEEDLR